MCWCIECVITRRIMRSATLSAIIHRVNSVNSSICYLNTLTQKYDNFRRCCCCCRRQNCQLLTDDGVCDVVNGGNLLVAVNFYIHCTISFIHFFLLLLSATPHAGLLLFFLCFFL